jgi:hypothetical protein
MTAEDDRRFTRRAGRSGFKSTAVRINELYRQREADGLHLSTVHYVHVVPILPAAARSAPSRAILTNVAAEGHRAERRPWTRPS